MSVAVVLSIVLALVITGMSIWVAIASSREDKAKKIAEQNKESAKVMAAEIMQANKTIETQVETAKKVEEINNEQVEKIIQTSTGTDSDKFNASIDVLSDYSKRRSDNGS